MAQSPYSGQPQNVHAVDPTGASLFTAASPGVVTTNSPLPAGANLIGSVTLAGATLTTVLGVQTATTLTSSATIATVTPQGYAPISYSYPANGLVGTLTPYYSLNGTTWTATTMTPTGGTAQSSIVLSGGANAAATGTITQVAGAVAYQVQVSGSISGTMALTLTAGLLFDSGGNLRVGTTADDAPVYEDNPNGVAAIAPKPNAASAYGITPTSTLFASSGVGGIKSSAGNVYGLMLTNIDSSAHFIFLVATNTPAAGSPAVVPPITVPANSTITVTFPAPVQLAAIGLADMTTAAGGTLQTNQKVYYTPFFK
jgi:hypothetical protein